MSQVPAVGPNGTGSAQAVGGGAGAPLGRGHLARLFRLVLILQAEKSPNARVLAERCEVSTRTIYRDIELLEQAGVPVRFRTDRQGYQLARGFFLPPTNLDELEALALLVMSRQWKGGDGLGLLRHAWSGAVKLAEGLSPDIRARVLSYAEPFQIERSHKLRPADSRDEMHDLILEALTRQRQLRLWYHTADHPDELCTKFGIYRLLLHDRHWFMVGRSTLHRRIEVIGVPWVHKAVLTDDPYGIPPRFSLDRFLANAWGVERAPVRSKIWLRFSPRVAAEVGDTVWHRSQRRALLADGSVELHFQVDGLEEILRWILGFGDLVEVIAPDELRRRVHDVATAVARRHEAHPRNRLEPSTSPSEPVGS